MSEADLPNNTRQVGQVVYIRGFFGHQYWSGTIMKIGKDFYGKKYLIEYGVRTDFGSHYRAMKWFHEWRLV